MTSAAQLGNFDVVSFYLTRPLVGLATFEGEVDVDEDQAPPAGALDFTFTAEGGAATSYRVTVIDVLPGGDLGRETMGRFRVFAVAGAGGLRRVLEPRDYAEVSARLIAEDILSDAGELAGDLSALDAVPRLARWLRPRGTGKAALTRLCQRFGLSWRSERDGRVSVVAETWPAYTLRPPYLSEPDAAGLCDFDLDAPDLEPGQTVQRPEGRVGAPYQVAAVVYSIGAGEGVLRTRAQLQRPEGGEGPERERWRAAVGSVLPPFALYVPHLATVVDQDDDGKLGLRLDDPGAPALTLSGVRIWPGLPGATVKPKKGSRVVVEFAGGNEDSPIVTGFEPAGEFKVITIGSGPPDTQAQVLQIGSDS